MRNFILAMILLLLTACVSMPAPTYQPAVANTQVLMHGDRSTISLGEFGAAQGVENTTLSVRGSSLGGGSDGTFSTYIHDALQAELQAAGRYDPAASSRLSGTLIENKLDGGSTRTGTASLSAHFILTRQQTPVYGKTLAIKHQWDSSFMGAIAIPAAMNNYATAVQKLIGQLFADPDFVQASGGGVAVAP